MAQTQDNIIRHPVQWFAMRVAYGRERRVKAALDELDIETFLPLRERFVNTRFGKRLRLMPLIPHLIFVHTTEKRLYEIKNGTGVVTSMRYMMNHENQKIIVPDKQLEDYRRVVESDDDQHMILDNQKENIKVGRKVVITQGQFAGIEGTIQRIDGNRSIVVTLADLAYAAIRFVPRAFWKEVELK